MSPRSQGSTAALGFPGLTESRDQSMLTHTFNKYELSTDYMPGTIPVLGLGATAVTQPDQIPVPLELII